MSSPSCCVTGSERYVLFPGFGSRRNIGCASTLQINQFAALAGFRDQNPTPPRRTITIAADTDLATDTRWDARCVIPYVIRPQQQLFADHHRAAITDTLDPGVHDPVYHPLQPPVDCVAHQPYGQYR